MDENSHWWVIDLLTLQKLDIHQSRGKLYWQQMPLTRQDILFWDVTILQLQLLIKPLLKIFGDKSLDQISNPRLRNLKE